jgi:hypothetical protein
MYTPVYYNNDSSRNCESLWPAQCASHPTPKCNFSTGNIPLSWSTFHQDLKNKPSSLSDAFILADLDNYPTIREIFHILLTACQ